MSYYNYGSNIIQNLTTLETLTLTSSGFTYKNSTTTFIPWSTLSNINSSLSVSSLNSSSGNFSSIDSNISTLNIGTVNATTINVGKSNTSLNVISGIINASNLMIYSDFSQALGGNPACYLDTIPRGSFLANVLCLGTNNASCVTIGGTSGSIIYMGISLITPTSINNILIGNASSTVTISASSLNIGSDNSSITINSSTLFKNTLFAKNIDAIPNTLTIGPVNASFINLGNQNTSVNVSSGIINASALMIYSGNKVNPLNTTCWLDTIPASSGVRQIAIGQTNAHEVYIGAGSKNTKVDIGNIANTTNQINIGNASSTVAINASSLNIGSENSKQINVGVTDLNTTYKGQIHIGPYYNNTATGVYINDACSDSNQFTSICTNSSSTIQIGCANGTRTSPFSLYGNIRINPDGVNNSTTIGCATVPTIISTKLSVDGSAVNAGTNILTIKQNSGDYLLQTDGVKDPFSITSPNSGTLSVNNSNYNSLTMGMGVDTTYNCGYINCAMSGAVRPIAIGGRNGADTYIGYAPTNINKTESQSGGNLYVKGSIYLPNRYGGIVFNNGLGPPNTITSYIVDDGELHICTDNYMYFKINCTSVGGVSYGTTKMYIDLNGVNVYGYVFPKGDVIFNNDGSGLRWGGVGGGVSRIVDDGTLKICTDDWMEFKTGSSSTALGDTKMRIDTSNTIIYNNFINQSDIKLKKDIVTVNNALDKVLALRGVYFTYINTNTRSIGVIAQEVQEVLPEIVIDVEGMLAVSYISFAGVFIEAIKEMKTDYDKKIADLERRLLALESKP